MLADKTQHLELNLPYGDEFADVALTNENFSTLDTEVFKRVKAVNGVVPDEDGNAIVEEVPFARNLVTDQQQESGEAFLMRTTGGTSSVSDGAANLISIYGRSMHTGVVHEVLDMTVHSEPRSANLESEMVDEGITATLDRTTFITKVNNPASITVTLTYTSAWSENPALYGVTVTGVPVSGDSITIRYVRASRGTIAQSGPGGFRSTGWNLYNHSLGYARVMRYSGTYGFLVGGTYTKLEYSETLGGARTEITVTSGSFTIPGDGYVWVTGGNNTNTYIVMTWSDWGAGPEGGWKIYSESFIDLSTVMGQYFPYGLCSVGAVSDQIDIAGQRVIRRIDRIDYTDSAMESIVASSLAYDADTDYIYVVMDTPEVNTVTLNSAYTANDHGMEFIDGSDVAPFVLTLYGENLVDKLRTDIPNKLTALSQDIGKVNAGLAYVENGNTISANANYTEGKFICWKGEIYRVRTTINATVTSSNWTTYLTKQDGIGGALTSINNDLTSLNSKIANVQDGLAIVANGNTHAAIASGQYVYVKNHSSLAEGLYKATAAIGTNAALSTSNLTADSQGGLNALKASVDTLNSKIPHAKTIVCGATVDIYITNKSGNRKATFLILTGNTDVVMATAFSNGPKIVANRSGDAPMTISDDNGRMKITSNEFYYATAQIISMFDFDVSVT